MSTDITEVRKLAADLAEAPLKARRQVAVAVRKAALDVQAGAQQLVPVDTGATKNSIGVDLAASGATLSATIGPTTNYAPYLEFGTVHMAPRPFMGPAADAVAPLLEQAVAEAGGSIL